MGRLKRLLKVYAVIAAALVSALAFGACDKVYTPEEGTYYFEINGSYRVIEEIPAEHERIENYGLNSIILPTMASAFVIDVTVTDAFVQGSMFFCDANAVNRQGIIKVYEILGETDYKLNSNYAECSLTGLYSYNAKITKNKKYTVDLSESCSGRVGVGEVATVDKYTFNYKDLSFKDGHEIRSGAFTVFVCGEVYIGAFNV